MSVVIIIFVLNITCYFQTDYDLFQKLLFKLTLVILSKIIIYEPLSTTFEVINIFWLLALP